MKLTKYMRLAFVLAVLIALVAGIQNFLPRLLANTRVADVIRRLTGQVFFHIGGMPVTPAFLIKTAFYLIILWFASVAIRNLLQNRLLAHTSLDFGQRYSFSRITSYLIFLVGLVIGLQSAGINLNSVLVVSGAVGIGVGLGLQSLANNFVCGLVLLLERPIRLGDRVEVGGVLGDIVRMAARSTWVRTNENVVIIVPNSEFISTRVINWTVNDPQVRISLPVGVSYSSDPEKVRALLLETALRHPDVLQSPPPDVLFSGFGDSALNFELRIWSTRQVHTPMILKSDLYFAIFRAFSQNGIEIPFPQRDLHVKSVALPIPFSPAP
jgi:small-conductance mechanosensitive channel